MVFLASENSVDLRKRKLEEESPQKIQYRKPSSAERQIPTFVAVLALILCLLLLSELSFARSSKEEISKHFFLVGRLLPRKRFILRVMSLYQAVL